MQKQNKNVPDILLVKDLDQAIKALRNCETEYLFAFKRGKRILGIAGDQNKITVDNALLLNLKDAIVVHNHPGKASFSIEDIMALIKYNAKEGILVSGDYIYKIYRPLNGWKLSIEKK